MNTCYLCYGTTRNRKRNERGELLCNDCREAAAYYDSLTPEERRIEEEWIATYTAEVDAIEGHMP